MALVSKKIHQEKHVLSNVQNHDFSKLINWTSAYFDLFLQEDLKNKLIIFCPNGAITIQHCEHTLELKIVVENKITVACSRYCQQILHIYNCCI
ncbi:hypothetical protein BTO06_01340 [Tenacibaculum sp. SZ-18]|nr:hypothetical protein BTO06_01340 [Tenacibaculum sp. SZ-18]